METVKAARAAISEYKLNSPLAWLLVPPPIKLENELRKYGDQTDVSSPRVIKFPSFAGANELDFLERSGCAQCATKDFFSIVNGLVEQGKWRV
jgi:hypothetical protein